MGFVARGVRERNGISLREGIVSETGFVATVVENASDFYLCKINKDLLVEPPLSTINGETFSLSFGS